MRRLLIVLCSIILWSAPAWSHEDGAIEVDVLAKTGASWDGSALPGYPEKEPEITILRITIPPGARLPLHRHPVINAGVLLRGALMVETSNGQTLRLDAGEPIVEVVGKWHSGKSVGEEPAEIVVFYAGTPDLPITVTAEAAE